MALQYIETLLALGTGSLKHLESAAELSAKNTEFEEENRNEKFDKKRRSLKVRPCGT